MWPSYPLRSLPTQGNALESQRGAWASLFPSRLTGNGRSVPVMVAKRTGQIRCNRWSIYRQTRFLSTHLHAENQTTFNEFSERATGIC